uniref:Ovule protein n=1 Tax=Taenia asiatica TaxID=60517 RepID=A0A0R3WD84_TAEAS
LTENKIYNFHFGPNGTDLFIFHSKLSNSLQVKIKSYFYITYLHFELLLCVLQIKNRGNYQLKHLPRQLLRSKSPQEIKQPCRAE